MIQRSNNPAEVAEQGDAFPSAHREQGDWGWLNQLGHPTKEDHHAYIR